MKRAAQDGNDAKIAFRSKEVLEKEDLKFEGVLPLMYGFVREKVVRGAIEGFNE